MILILIFFAAHWYISLFFQTFFHHRYAAHEMFNMSKRSERWFIFLSWLSQGSSYLAPWAYGALHRMHHKYADQRRDPHSPKYSKNIWKMMWRTKLIFSRILNKKFPVPEKLMQNLPRWDWFDQNIADTWPSRLAWGTFYVLVYAFAHFYLGASWWWFLLLPIHFLMGPVHGAVINWFAHTLGWKRRFKRKDTSINLFPVDWLMLGEGYHNNHHQDSTRANFGIRWYEIDPVYPFIKLFHWMGIIKLKRSTA